MTDHEDEETVHTKEVKNVVTSSEDQEETQIGPKKAKSGHKKKDEFAAKLADGAGKVAAKHIEGACKCKSGKGCACLEPKKKAVVRAVGEDHDELAQEEEDDFDLY